MYIHTYIYIYTYIHTYIHTDTYIHTYIHTLWHTYIHTHIHTHIHTPTRTPHTRTHTRTHLHLPPTPLTPNTAVTYHSSWHVSLRNSRRTGRGNVVAHACTRYSRQLQRGIYGTQIKRRFGVYHPVITVTVVFNSWQLLAWLMHHNRSHRLYRYIYSTYIYKYTHIHVYIHMCIYMHT